MPRTPEQLAEQTIILKETLHDYCNQDDKTWLEFPTSFNDFYDETDPEKGKIKQLIFHKSSLGPEALNADIQQFADRLHQRLDFVQFRAITDEHVARAALRLQAAKKDERMSSLAQTVVDHYEKR